MLLSCRGERKGRDWAERGGGDGEGGGGVAAAAVTNMKKKGRGL